MAVTEAAVTFQSHAVPVKEKSDPAPPAGSHHEADEDYPSSLRTSVIVFAVGLSLFCIGLDMTILATAIPAITNSFPGIDLTGWYSSAFFITLAAAQPVWGKVYQYFSMKYAFVAAVCIFEIGSLLAGVAPNAIALIIGRAITGVGAAGIASGGYTIMPVVLRPHLRAIATGLVTTVYSVAQAVGPLAGGALAGEVTWRWCFYINLPIGAVAGFTVLFFFQGPKQIPVKNLVPLREKLAQIDYLGSLLVVGALVCYTRALQVAGIEVPWSSSQVIGLLVGAFVIFLALCGTEKLLGDRAMIVHKLLRTRLVIVGFLYGFFFEGAAYSILYAIPLHFQAVDGVSPEVAGIHNVPFLIACGVGSAAAGFGFSRTRLAQPNVIFACGVAAVGTGLIYTLDVGSPAGQWIGYQVLAGLGYGAGLPLGIILAHTESEPDDIATSTALLLMSFNIGSALSLGAAQSLLDNLLINRMSELVPTVDPAKVFAVGIDAVRVKFDPDVVPGIIESYLYGLRAIYIWDIVFAGAALWAGLFYPWRKLGIRS